MKRIYVDFNAREVSPDKQSVAIALPGQDASSLYGPLAEGEEVLVYDEGTECRAILRIGSRFPWVADILVDTIKHVSD
jgi:hypothetical protein